MAETDFEYATDNDPDLRYVRKLGSGGFGSVHEVCQHVDESDLDILRSWEAGSTMQCTNADAIVLREEATSSPF
jgi:succinylarginine dihydrolase